ncbi:acyl-CoA/acyl-ACP dehydrogenase [Ancylobacter sp. Lp-2]|uniref:acyl-CoA dehydrogenase family protein n=1 Tax=Ancylobacter sp. Lp-2 TaxID=2881339 RepID=UPI001E5F2EE2|nr:acyl-CoA dehydrogenase family protein [Ancylobacter sp. Lp-2]MCB4771238.1 acyl-CoA/acyl-ACP dehydrogenase [Ancylobacter sp. Lp-2]
MSEALLSDAPPSRLARLARHGTALARARKLAAQFARTAAHYDTTAEVPVANFAALHAEGLSGLTASPAHGGAGTGLAEAVEVIRILAQGEPSTALILFMQYLNLATLPHGRWDPALVSEVLTQAVATGGMINSLRVEPELGSPTRGGLPATLARRTAAGWSISGRKIYSTGSSVLGWMIVWARTDEPEVRVGRFAVPVSSPGIVIEPTWNALGMRASGSHDVVFDAVAVPARYAADLRRPEEWTGKEPLQAAWHGVLLGAVYDGIARAARDWVAGFLNERVPTGLGAPLATLPRVQEEMGRIERLLQVNEALSQGLARAVDEGRLPTPEQAGLAKLTVTENAIAAVDIALRLSANHGIARANPLERHHRNVLCGRIHTPQEDAALVAAGKTALSAALAPSSSETSS